MTDIRLTVQGLAVDYPTARVVDNVSFTLGNERLALVGESGSGKTTLARILLGFERADAGQVTKLGIARTFQNIRLWKSMTVFENVLVAKHMRARQNRRGAQLRSTRNLRKKAPNVPHKKAIPSTPS